MKLWHFVRSGRLQRDSFDIALTALDDAGVPYVMRVCRGGLDAESRSACETCP